MVCDTDQKLFLMFQLNAPVVMETEGSKQHCPQLSQILQQRIELKKKQAKSRLYCRQSHSQIQEQFKSNSIIQPNPYTAMQLVFRLVEGMNAEQQITQAYKSYIKTQHFPFNYACMSDLLLCSHRLNQPDKCSYRTRQDL